MRDLQLDRRSREGRRAREHLVGENAERVLIARRARLGAVALLRAHVRRRADRRARLREVLRVDHARDAEVHHDRTPLAVHHDVRRLDVAMHHALAVRVVERAGNLRENRLRHRNRKRLVLREQVIERAAVDVLHHEVQEAVLLLHRMDVDDVRMVELRRGARLGEEPVPHALTVREPRQHNLDGHAAVELQVLREKDGGHSAASELSPDLVLAECGGAELLEELQPRVETGPLAAQERRAGDRVTASAAEPVASGDGRATAWAGYGDWHVDPQYQRVRGRGEGSPGERVTLERGVPCPRRRE